MPASHAQSLDNLCSAFIHSSQPPPAHPEAPGQDPTTIHTDPSTDPPAAAAGRRTELRAVEAASSDSWTFTAAEVAMHTKGGMQKTSAGPDSILPLFLRHGGPALHSALAAVFNYSWRHSVTPQAWREANVTALYKGKGKRTDPLSYRPISVTSGIARTFEHLIHDRLVADIGPILATSQFGFRKRRSTSDAILQLLTPLQYLCGKSGKYEDEEKQQTNKTNASSRKLRCAALFLDIRKAFDRVDHDILLTRLHGAGVRGQPGAGSAPSSPTGACAAPTTCVSPTGSRWYTAYRRAACSAHCCSWCSSTTWWST